MVVDLNTGDRKAGELLSIISPKNFKKTVYLLSYVGLTPDGTERQFDLVIQSSDDLSMKVGSEITLTVPLSEPLKGSVYNPEEVQLMSMPDKLRGAAISLIKMLMGEYADLQANIPDVIAFLKAAGYLEPSCGEKKAKNFLRSMAGAYPGFFELTQKARVLRYTGKQIEMLNVPDASKAGMPGSNGPIQVDFPTLVHGIRLVITSFSCFKLNNDGVDE